MAVLIKYHPTDGGIVATWEAEPPSLLQAQIVTDDPTVAFLLVETEQAGREIATTYYVAEGGLCPKRPLVLTAVPTSFPAGVGHYCHITVAPFEPCIVLVDGIPYALTEEDQTLELGSEEPHTFVIMLAPMAQVRAEPLNVEAR